MVIERFTTNEAGMRPHVRQLDGLVENRPGGHGETIQTQIKIDVGDLRPMYDADNKGNLIPSAALLSLATSLGIEHQVL